MIGCKLLQRFFDVVFSVVALVILCPVLLVVSVILRFTGEREVFFYQDRVGMFRRNIIVIKFATMLKNSPNIGTRSITLIDDPRVLPLGNFLRKTKINELLQLINVIRGDMSLIGPRPLTYENFSMYTPDMQELLSSVRPGLSGVASIVFRDEQKFLSDVSTAGSIYKSVIAPYKSDLEYWYVKNNSITLYFKLIICTVHAVLYPKSNLLSKLCPNIPKPPSELNF